MVRICAIHDDISISSWSAHLPYILIRRVSARTKERLKQRAKRHGKSLEADLRETLDLIADEDRRGGHQRVGFGTWLASISRPGVDLDETHSRLRSARPRRVEFE
jgi:plasmid stability protein